MKKYLSVFSLYIRSNIYKLISVVVFMALAQILMFKNVLRTAIVVEPTRYVLLGIENFIDKSNIILVFGSAFLILTVFLTIMGCEFGAKQGYTLRRLRISEKEILFCQTAANALMYTIFLISEVVVAFVLCQMYMNFAVETNTVEATHINNQTIFLAFYRNDFLHSILPLDDILVHLKNITAIAAMGFTSAVFPYFSRRGRLSLEMFILLPIIILNFASPSYFSIGACGVLAGIALIRVGTEAETYD